MSPQKALLTVWALVLLGAAPAAVVQEPQTLVGVREQLGELAQQAAEARARAQEIIEQHRQTPAATRLLELKTRFVEELLHADMLSAAVASLHARGDLEGMLKEHEKLETAEKEVADLKAQVFEQLKAAEAVRKLSKVNVELNQVWDRGVSSRSALQRWRQLDELLQELDTTVEKFAAELARAEDKLAALEHQAGAGEPHAVLGQKLERTKTLLVSVRECLKELNELRTRKVTEAVQLTGLPDELQARQNFRDTCADLARLEARARANHAWVDQSFRALVGLLYQPRLIAMDGRVFLKKPGGEMKLLFEPIELDRGDILQTGPQAGVNIEFEDGSVVGLGPESLLELPQGGTTWRCLRAGSARLHTVAAVPTTTPLVKVVSRTGSELSMMAGDAMCRVAVTRGQAEIVDIKSGQKLTLQDGQSATITSTAFPDKPD